MSNYKKPTAEELKKAEEAKTENSGVQTTVSTPKIAEQTEQRPIKAGPTVIQSVSKFYTKEKWDKATKEEKEQNIPNLINLKNKPDLKH